MSEKNGHIYCITDLTNNMKYVGQTCRDMYIRFDEHCTFRKDHWNSYLDTIIHEKGRSNFKLELLEECPLSQLDKREQFWIQQLDTFNNGYNRTLGGQTNNFNQYYDKIKVVENNLIIDSKEELSRLISETTSWSMKYIKQHLTRIINTDETFCGYHFISVTPDQVTELSDYDVIIDWIKKLNIQYCGKHIYCISLKKEFDTIAEAAKYLLDNNYYIGVSKNPIQTIVTSIGQNLKGKTEYMKSSNGNLEFCYMPGSTKQHNDEENLFKKKKVYCPELDYTANSVAEMAEYMLSNEYFIGIKLKTATLRISDVARGYFTDYKNYTFKYI